MAKLQFPFQAFSTTRAACKVLSLWNGVGNNAAPTGWELPAYDDSAWAAPVVPTLAWSTASQPTQYTRAGYGAFTVPELIAPWATPPSAWAAFLIRWTFTAPATPYAVFALEPSYCPTSGGIDLGLDGTYAINGNVSIATGWRSLENFGWVTAGQTTVVALQGAWSGSPPAVGAPTSRWGNGGNATPPYDAWVAARLVFYDPTNVGGQVYSWGTITAAENDKGVFGTGDATTHLTPTPMDMVAMPSPHNAAKVASNGKTTLILTVDGQVYGCGDNSLGMALANNTTDTSAHLTPLRIDIGETGAPCIVDVDIGDDCAMALDRFGDVHMWGPNTHGSLGRGNTTAQNVPTTIGSGFFWQIAAGRDYSVLATQNAVQTAGGNTYGQLGQGTSGADVLTYGTFLSYSGARTDAVAAGDAQTIVTTNTQQIVCGRAEFGSLANTAYNSGTGPNKIVSTPLVVTGELGASPQSGLNRAESVQSGAVTYSAQYALIEGALVSGSSVGDGRPYGGTGVFFSDVTVYGIDPQAFATFDFFTVAALATNSAASQNDYTVGDSKVVGAWVGTDGKLYTFGWGGAGQMGSGSDPTTNTVSTSINGLTQVVAATVCRAGMFAISLVLVPSSSSRHFMQILG